MAGLSRGIAAVGAVVMLLSACSSGPSDGPTDDSGVDVVATTSVIADVVEQIVKCADPGGADPQDAVESTPGSVTTLIPAGADPHDFSPSSEAVATMVRSDLVISNGLGLEEGLASALASASADGATVLELAPLLDPIPFSAPDGDVADRSGEPDSQGHGHDGHDHEGDDPHVWLDAARMAIGSEVIGAELAKVTGRGAYRACGEQVAAELRRIDEEVTQILSAVPADRRVLVTDHDSLGYFAEAYGFDVLGVVIPGGSTSGQPSSAQLAALAGRAADAGVDAIFLGNSTARSLVEALAGEVGDDVQVVELSIGSPGEQDSANGTYRSMMTGNAQKIADALQSGS